MSFEKRLSPVHLSLQIMWSNCRFSNCRQSKCRRSKYIGGAIVVGATVDGAYVTEQLSRFAEYVWAEHVSWICITPYTSESPFASCVGFGLNLGEGTGCGGGDRGGGSIIRMMMMIDDDD